MSRLRLGSRLESLAASLARVAAYSGLVRHNEVAEKTNLLASYVETKTVDESHSTDLDLIPARCALIAKPTEKLNAINHETPKEIKAAIEWANANREIHLIFLEVAGKGFCGGYDLSLFAKVASIIRASKSLPCGTQWTTTLT
jgi:hypothetical protein